MPDQLTTLTELLKELPGIGPRQARRLAFWLVRRKGEWVKRLSAVLLEAHHSVHTCTSCMRLFPQTQAQANLCNICSNSARDAGLLMLVEKDVDLENIEKTGTYKGRYFVLGGTTSPLDKEPERHIRINALLKHIQDAQQSVSEVIFALSATTEGEDTVTYVKEKLESFIQKDGIKVSELGRGLSTGTELEYVDADTMKSALQGRH